MVSVVSFRSFRFVVSGFSTCRLVKARSNFTASQIDHQKRFLCFNQEQITKELWPRVPQSSSLCPSCAKEKSSGVENGSSID